MTPSESPGWSALHSETLCDTPWLRVTRDRVATPTRPKGVEWMIAHRRTAAVIAPRTADGRFLLVRQERIAVRQTLWEFPAGMVDGEVTDHSIRETALRELGEESGMECVGELLPLGLLYSSVGFTTECCHLFLATNVTPREEGSDHDEHEAILETRLFSPNEFTAMVASGEIVDSNTLASYARLAARGLLL